MDKVRIDNCLDTKEMDHAQTSPEMTTFTIAKIPSISREQAVTLLITVQRKLYREYIAAYIPDVKHLYPSLLDWGSTFLFSYHLMF